MKDSTVEDYGPEQAERNRSASVHFSSATDQWSTPADYFAQVDALYHFEIDVCADETNAKCNDYFDIDIDGLTTEWAPSRCWMNPPYGREVGNWVKKAFEESGRGALVACLLPARTDTRWWQDYCEPVRLGLIPGTVTFIRGRLKFGNATNSAPFPSALVVFLPRQG